MEGTTVLSGVILFTFFWRMLNMLNENMVYVGEVDGAAGN